MSKVKYVKFYGLTWLNGSFSPRTGIIKVNYSDGLFRAFLYSWHEFRHKATHYRLFFLAVIMYFVEVFINIPLGRERGHCSLEEKEVVME